MALSNWNVLMERMSVTPLTKRERQVVAAIARRTLGWVGKAEGDRISARQIATQTGLDRRDVGKTLHALIERRIILSRGGRERTVAILSVNVDPLTPWVTKQRSKGIWRQNDRQLEEETPKQHVPESPPDLAVVAPPRNRKGKKEQSPAASAAPRTFKDFRQDVFDAYLGSGGRFKQGNERTMLGAQAKRLAAAGVGERLILSAAADLGRNKGYAGHLKKRADEIVAGGGLCTNEAYDRAQTDTGNLKSCGCARCLEAIEVLLAEVRRNLTEQPSDEGREEAASMEMTLEEWADWKIAHAWKVLEERAQDD